MADENDFADYPKGRVALGAGDLIDCTVFDLAYADGEKVLATLRQNPAGSTGGAKSISVTLEFIISQAGFERDWMGAYEKRKVQEMRLKIPGITFICTGRMSNPSLNSTVDDAIKFKFTLVGKAKTAPV